MTTHADPMTEPAGPAPHTARPFTLAPDVDTESAVFRALGAASTCWSPSTGDAVFDSEKAAQIGYALIDHLRRLRLLPAAPTARIDAVDALHDAWSQVDVATLDPLLMWEELGRVLAGGAR